MASSDEVILDHYAAIWDLDAPSKEAKETKSLPTESFFTVGPKKKEEAVFDSDERTKVPPKGYQDGGAYRCMPHPVLRP
jgi:hypothetical protein